MEYEAKDFKSLLGMQEISDKTMETHFTLYEAYVKNTNLIQSQLAELLTAGEESSPKYAELKRRFGWEFNGMRLHEFFFGGLSKETKKLDSENKLKKQIEQDFGSFENWEKDFKATASMRGIGWAALYFDQTAGKLINTWINEHDAGHLASCQLILVLDVFEHAFFVDFGSKRADYLSAILPHLNWTEIQTRFEG